MSRTSAKTTAVAPAGERLRLLRSKGPLSPTETEITVYAGLADGQLVETPANLAIKTRAVAHLVTDRPALALAIAHKLKVEADEGATLATKIGRIGLGLNDASASDREAAVAGSLELIDKALDTAFRVLLFTDEAKPVIPAIFKDWKASKPDTKTTPPVITLTRD